MLFHLGFIDFSRFWVAGGLRNLRENPTTGRERRGSRGGPRRPSEIPTMDGFSRGLRSLFRDSSLSSLERDFAPTGTGPQGATGAWGGLAPTTLVGAFLTFHPWAKGQERSDPHG